MTEGWAYIDTGIYWNGGLNKIGEYGMVDFLSDRASRNLTRDYRRGTGLAGYMLPDRYYVISVVSKTKDESVFALYDDIDHTVLFDEPSLIKFADLLTIFCLTDDTGDIVAMAKKLDKKRGGR